MLFFSAVKVWMNFKLESENKIQYSNRKHVTILEILLPITLLVFLVMVTFMNFIML